MKSANELTFYNLFGVIAHGLGHGAVAANLRDENLKQYAEDDISYLEALSDHTWYEFILRLFYDQWAYWIFWVLLLKATMPQSSMKAILSLSVVSWLSSQRNKPSFQFTHVQTILLLAFTLNQLCRPRADKDFAYYMYGLLVSFPLGIVGWIESIMCSSTVIHYGGHVLYDAYIPISSLVFYLMCYFHREPEMVKSKMK